MKNSNHSLELDLPSSYLYLCKLLQIPPEKMLVDFASTFSAAHMSTGMVNVYVHLLSNHRYGKGKFREEQIVEMLSELRTISSLFPSANREPEEWREKLLEHWIDKWTKKPGH